MVHEGLFTPAAEIDSTARKQINVQILEPESHNNGQFLKETTYVKEENSTIVSSTTTTTTTAATSPTTATAITSTTILGPFSTTTLKSLSANLLPPMQAGLRLTNEARQNLDEDCSDAATSPVAIPRKEEQRTVVSVHKNVRVNKVLASPVPYGARKLVGVPTKRPCESDKCVEQTTRGYLPPSLPPSTTQQPPLLSSPPVPVVPVVPVKVVHQPVIVHTRTEVPVEKIVPVEVEKLVVKEVRVPVDRVITVPTIVEKRVPVEKIVEKPVIVEKHVPVDRIVEKFIDRPITQIVEKFVDRPITQIVEKFVDRPITQIVEKIVDRPVEVEKIVEKHVPVERVVAIDRPVPIQVGVPVEIPYLVHVEVPIHTPYPYPVRMPYLIKPPPPKQHYFFKTSKSKDHGFFDFKHNHHKTIKHIFLKQPTISLIEDHLHSPHPYPFDTFGMLPPPPPPPPSPISPISFQTLDAIPLNLNQNYYEHREPRYQSVNSYDSQVSGSQNVISTALPGTSLNAYHSHHFHSHKNLVAHQPAARHNFPGSLNIKELRWEYGFKPPLIPSTEIDDFGNPVKKNKNLK